MGIGRTTLELTSIRRVKELVHLERKMGGEEKRGGKN